MYLTIELVILEGTFEVFTTLGGAFLRFERAAIANWILAIRTSMSVVTRRERVWQTRKNNIDKVNCLLPSTVRVSIIAPAHNSFFLHVSVSFNGIPSYTLNSAFRATGD